MCFREPARSCPMAEKQAVLLRYFYLLTKRRDQPSCPSGVPRQVRAILCSYHLQAHTGESQGRMMSGIYTWEMVFFFFPKAKGILIFYLINYKYKLYQYLLYFIFLFPISSSICLCGALFQGTIYTPHRVAIGKCFALSY